MPNDGSAPIVEPAGLTADEVRARRDQFGPNEPAPARAQSIFVRAWRVVTNPLALILLIAATASVLLGQTVDATIIFIIVVISAAIDLAQTRRSDRAIARLRDRVAPTATVRRDGQWTEIPRREIVPGDVIRLSAGDLIPADARLLAARDLFVQQAALTGESLPAEKEATDAAASTSADAANMVFFGTSERRPPKPSRPGRARPSAILRRASVQPPRRPRSIADCAISASCWRGPC